MRDVSPPRQDPGPATAVLVITEPVTRDAAPALCDRLQTLLRESRAEVIVIDVRGLLANASSIEAIVRMQLAVRRRGREIRLHRVSPELEGLLSFVGLSGVVETGGAGGTDSGRRGGRQPEQREQPRGVQERVDRDDPLT